MKIAWMLIVGMLLWGTAANGQEKDKTASPPPQNSKTEQSPAPEGYKIGPQDVLRIDVWKEPDISRVIPVRPDGKISLPLLNDVQAAGLTSIQLAGVIRDGLTKYITNPQVTVTVTEINSRRVYCNGEFVKPGALTLLPNMTALQAISSCGGFTQFAKIKAAYLLRVQDGKQSQLPLNYKEVVKGKGQDVVLQPADILVAP